MTVGDIILSDVLAVVWSPSPTQRLRVAHHVDISELALESNIHLVYAALRSRSSLHGGLRSKPSSEHQLRSDGLL